jgi:DNA-binding MarR family transcriptional regulator
MLMLKDLPRYECLLEAMQRFPDMDPSACEAYLTLLRAGDEAYSKSEDFLNRHAMTPGRFTLLMLLFDKLSGCSMPRTPAELADKAGVARATITGLVDTLERDGLVTRRHDAGDRRMMQVDLTARGKAVLEEMLPGYFKQMAAQMARLTELERKTLVQLLNKAAGQESAAPLEALHRLAAGSA